MAAFRFEASDSSGKLQKGILDADSPRHVRSLLRDRGLTPLDVSPAAQNDAGSQNILASKLSSTDLASCTRQLASLLAAKLPIEQSLNAVIEQAE